MKTVLFFDRLALTKLYILMSCELQKYDDIKVVHVAYCDDDVKLLRDAGIKNYIHYKELLSQTLEEVKITKTLLKEIDDLIISESKGRFTMNGSIQSDRCFSILTYEEAIKLSAAHYLVWKGIFSKGHIDIVYHEPCSMFMTHILAMLCKAQGGIFRYPTQEASDKDYYTYLNIDGENFKCPELEERYHYYKQHTDKIDRVRCTAYLDKFRKEFNVFMGDMFSHKRVSVVWLHISSIKCKLLSLLKKHTFDNYVDLIELWQTRQNISQKRLHNIIEYRRKNISFITDIPQGEQYYYYSIHLEPEATVLYLSDGIYTNQIKLIENIAASIPAGCYLYVKDHPHEYAYRSADDYERLLKIPNVRLIDQFISGKKLIAGSIGVFTINGTAGLEGLLLGKQVFCFGHSYYSFHPYVNYIHNVRDIRKIVYASGGAERLIDDTVLAYVNAYFDALHKGFVTYFGIRPEGSVINPQENACIIVEDLVAELRAIKKQECNNKC